MSEVEQVVQKVIIRFPGPQGPPGPTGGGSFYYLHTQSSPSTTWPVAHGLGKKPSVDVIIGGAIISGARVDHVDLNNLVVSVNTPQVGEVVCS